MIWEFTAVLIENLKVKHCQLFWDIFCTPSYSGLFIIFISGMIISTSRVYNARFLKIIQHSRKM